MTDLITRLEKEGGSRELDAEIFRALDYQLPDEFASKKISLDWRPDGSAMMEVGDMVVSYNPPPFTRSLDAAIALCERAGWEIVMMHRPLREWEILLQGGEDDEPFLLEDWQSSQLLPIALCIALLRALETEEK